MAMFIRSVVAMVPVADVTRSIAFYRRLGFRVDNTFTPDGQTAPSWAWLAGGGGSLMLTCSEAALPPSAARVLFYLYSDDVSKKHAELTAEGIAVGPICRPFYAPQGEFEVVDPDGYVLMFSHSDQIR